LYKGGELDVWRTYDFREETEMKENFEDLTQLVEKVLLEN
jgi:hypothetical protein